MSTEGFGQYSHAGSIKTELNDPTGAKVVDFGYVKLYPGQWRELYHGLDTCEVKITVIKDGAEVQVAEFRDLDSIYLRTNEFMIVRVLCASTTD